ncbi:SIS domain-containing protein [Candidatus Poriferisodalis sp.]|uniref:SIS domain-containing protein n=1 Tax=Candidatus Poriferisodalis sp. TaxID=3101277 RepID=UPI003B012E4A
MTSPQDVTALGDDTLGMAAAVEALPSQLEAALDAAAGMNASEWASDVPVSDVPVSDVPISDVPISNVIVMGMGGSGIAGDIVAALAAPVMSAPVAVAKGYECPAFVGPSTLAIAVSFSGNTEETLEAASAAHDAGASMIAVTSGGRLADLAREWGAPLYEVDASIPMPRAAVGAISVAPLVALERAGLLSGVAGWVRAAVAQLQARQHVVAADASHAFGDGLDGLIAEVGTGELLAVFYGGGALGAVAAGRAKAQVNENAKLPAYASAMPELCHNELAGWDLAGRLVHGSPLAVIALRHQFEHPQIRRRYEYTRRVLGGARIAVPYSELHAAGAGPMAQLFDLIYQVDALSLRMAAAARRDPGPVTLLTGLKDFLADGTSA